MDEHDGAAAGENDKSQTGPDPFLAPQVELDHAPAQEASRRPSRGLVGALVILQTGLVCGIAVFAAEVSGNPWWVWASVPLGALLGAVLVGILETSRRPGVRTVVSRTQLAWRSAPVWALLVMAFFIVGGARLPASTMPYFWLGAAIASTIIGLVHFGVTLLGLWLGSQADFSNPDQGSQ